MSLATKCGVGLLSLATVVATALPGLSLPGKLTSDANLRSGRSLTASVKEVLRSGGKVEVLNIQPVDDDYWYYVQSEIEGTEKGWIRSDLIRFNPIKVRAGNLVGKFQDVINIRSNPSIKSKVQHYGLGGDLVTILDSRKEASGYFWYKVKFPSNAVGWVREDVISVWPKGCIISCPDV